MSRRIFFSKSSLTAFFSDGKEVRDTLLFVMPVNNLMLFAEFEVQTHSFSFVPPPTR